MLITINILIMNELLFIGVLAIALITLMVSLRFGKEYLFVVTGIFGVFMSFNLVHPIEIFGWPILLSEIFFAVYFLTTDILTENYGEKEAKNLVWVMLGSVLFTVLVSKFIILAQVGDLSASLSNFFGPISVMILFITLIIMFFEQRFDIFAFSKIKKRTGGRYLWLRNCLSTFSIQSLDVLIVYPIFFYPIFGTEVWRIMLAALVFKFAVALIDTPFIYLSKKVIKKN